MRRDQAVEERMRRNLVGFEGGEIAVGNVLGAGGEKELA